MSRRKKIFKYVLATLAVGLIVVYFVANAVLDRVTRQTMSKVVGLAEQKGLELRDPDFQSVRVSGLLAATWSDLNASVRLPEGGTSGSNQLWKLHADRLRVHRGFSDIASLTIDRMTVVNADKQSSESASERRLEFQDVQCQCSLRLLDPEKSVRDLLPELIQVLSDSKTSLPLQLTGTLTFSLKGKPVSLGVEVAKQKDSHAIRLKHADFAQLSDRFDEKLTDAEVALIADYPLRAARLLQIKDNAESTASQANAQDQAVPEDAYRHILWSFLLARSYGEDFAKQVGDAHEKGDTGNTPAEREMDLHNNAIGRSYAAREYAQSAILSKLQGDANVRTSP